MAIMMQPTTYATPTANRPFDNVYIGLPKTAYGPDPASEYLLLLRMFENSTLKEDDEPDHHDGQSHAGVCEYQG